MKLHHEPFEKIKSGTKTLELRLYDAKRQKIALGDRIIFQKELERTETITTEVIGLVRYKNFDALLDDFAPEVYLGHANKSEALKGVSRFYTEADQEQHGVLGIRIRVT